MAWRTGHPGARNGRAPLGDGWSEHVGAVRRDRTSGASKQGRNYYRIGANFRFNADAPQAARRLSLSLGSRFRLPCRSLVSKDRGPATSPENSSRSLISPSPQPSPLKGEGNFCVADQGIRRGSTPPCLPLQRGGTQLRPGEEGLERGVGFDDGFERVVHQRFGLSPESLACLAEPIESSLG